MLFSLQTSASPELHSFSLHDALPILQNLLALRFTNSIFENLWDAKSIDHVQISISETVGLEGRASFYDDAGALRDMVQNHLLQLLCLVAMESPNKLRSEERRVGKARNAVGVSAR